MSKSMGRRFLSKAAPLLLEAEWKPMVDEVWVSSWLATYLKSLSRRYGTVFDIKRCGRQSCEGSWSCVRNVLPR